MGSLNRKKRARRPVVQRAHYCFLVNLCKLYFSLGESGKNHGRTQKGLIRLIEDVGDILSRVFDFIYVHFVIFWATCKAD